MQKRRRAERILLLVIMGLAMAALAVLYLTAPPPTVLAVGVINAETGAPLPGARVEVKPRNGSPLPGALTDDAGIVRFENAPADPAYRIVVQKADYDFGSRQALAVPKEQVTEVVLSLVPHIGDRLFVGLDKARITEIDTASWLTVQTVHLPVAPEARVYHLLLHPNADVLYAVAGNKGLILDSRSGATLGRMQVETGIDTLDLSADGHHLLLTTVRGGVDASGTLGLIHLLALDARSGEIVTDTLLLEQARLRAGDVLTGGGNDVDESAKGGNAAGTGLPTMPIPLWRPGGSYAYVLEATDPALRGLDVAGRSLLGIYLAPVGPPQVSATVVLSHDKRYAFAWHRGSLAGIGGSSDWLTILSVGDGMATDEDYPPGTSALAASPVTDELYILNGSLGTLTILDRTGEGRRRVVAVGKNPGVMAIEGDGRRAFVGNQGSQTVSVVDLGSGTVVFTVPLVGNPLSLAVR